MLTKVQINSPQTSLCGIPHYIISRYKMIVHHKALHAVHNNHVMAFIHFGLAEKEQKLPLVLQTIVQEYYSKGERLNSKVQLDHRLQNTTSAILTDS